MAKTYLVLHVQQPSRVRPPVELQPGIEVMVNVSNSRLRCHTNITAGRRVGGILGLRRWSATINVTTQELLPCDTLLVRNGKLGNGGTYLEFTMMNLNPLKHAIYVLNLSSP
ncbi:uncharacterized protein Z520_09004 [Fonsecaea multimorphosa CBS 102226]|uniref:Uncharacterized protein n=1 Tax=Fonsecaea multimorphosa CBS 102226 TaxID=1442371 RepID=A0A0D2KEE2_9EURO|nr:uncharacterized protein Z520_09004 [Fonsecaea multimorphosa CBS 102226]KIX95088.1 hypothetical protein Z520_09004 [Fonsecaea multimorphosa CBS 102226]OAL20810.1 hypothetical protein AYO22_08438 [Fonsecaea multimorphosa]